jgi:uncharacterized membrane protein (DUF485 family)
MTHATHYTRAPEPGRYVAFEPAPDKPADHFLPGSGDEQNGAPDFAAIRDSDDFRRVQRRLTRFIFPVSAAFLAWYLTFVLLAAYAPGLMGNKLFGSVTVGLLLGLSQFVTTVVIMLWYARFVRTKVDPEVEELRRRAGVGPDGR